MKNKVVVLFFAAICLIPSILTQIDSLVACSERCVKCRADRCKVCRDPFELDNRGVCMEKFNHSKELLFVFVGIGVMVLVGVVIIGIHRIMNRAKKFTPSQRFVRAYNRSSPTPATPDYGYEHHYRQYRERVGQIRQTTNENNAMRARGEIVSSNQSLPKNYFEAIPIKNCDLQMKDLINGHGSNNIVIGEEECPIYNLNVQKNKI